VFCVISIYFGGASAPNSSLDVFKFDVLDLQDLAGLDSPINIAQHFSR
jgi:hypothetical protein